MIKKEYKTDKGIITYWTNKFVKNKYTLIFLPGLTADHRLFDKQVEYFEDKYNVLVWDAPGHNLSIPFELSFDLFDKTRWLKEIIDVEKISKPIIIGQSMGSYVGQCFLELYKNTLKGFISIDSAPLQRSYITGIEIWLLERMRPIYNLYPWKLLIDQGSKGVAETIYGQNQMREMMETYTKNYYVSLVSHGYKILADCYKKDLKFKIDCPCILICGDKDKAGSAKNYNIRWHQNTNLPLYLIDDAGHNSNVDKPEEINKLIEEFLGDIKG